MQTKDGTYTWGCRGKSRGSRKLLIHNACEERNKMMTGSIGIGVYSGVDAQAESG